MREFRERRVVTYEGKEWILIWETGSFFGHPGEVYITKALGHTGQWVDQGRITPNESGPR